MGVALQTPYVELEGERSGSEVVVQGQDSEYVTELVKIFGANYSVGGVRIFMKNGIPRHRGLGSGTQYSLAIGLALARLFNIDFSIPRLAHTMGRGRVSGIGTGVFESGGFIIDSGVALKEGGHAVESDIPPRPMLSVKVPESWVFVVAIPNTGRGLSGKVEEESMSVVPSGFENLSSEICKIVLLRMVPALLSADAYSFGRGLSRVQELTGLFFSKEQVGIFQSETSEKCIRTMLSEGAYGAGQSSWGPAVYGLVDDFGLAKGIEARVRDLLARSVGGSVFISRCNNSGAIVREI